MIMPLMTLMSFMFVMVIMSFMCVMFIMSFMFVMIFIFVMLMGEFATAVVVYGGKASTVGTVILNYYAIANYPFAAVNALMLMLAMMIGVVIILRLVNIRKEL